MLRVNGFYGHIRRNDLRSLAFFAGFVLAFQLLAAVTLALPLFLLDARHAPFFPSAYLGRYGLPVLAAGAALFVAGLLRHAASIRGSVPFRAVDRRTEPRLVNIVETQAIAAGLPLPRVGILESPARNAFACGLGASSAVVVVTRGLLDALTDDELAAVAAHEIVHIRNGDIRLIAAADALMGTLLFVQKRNVLRIAGWKSAALAVLLPPYLFLSLLTGLVSQAALTLGRMSRLLISSSREFVADAEAVRLTQNPEALISALRRIENLSALTGVDSRADAMMIDGAAEGPYATHPTIAERIAMLRLLSGRPAGSREPGAERRPPALPASGPAPARRRLAARVTAGRTVNAFGLTPGARRALAIGFGLLVVLQAWTVLRYAAPEPSKPKRTVARQLPVPFERVEHSLGPAGERAPARASGTEVNRLSGLAPLAARCFATSRYGVGDRGLHPARPPDPARIATLAGGEHGSGSIELERYLALRVRSLRAVDEAAPAARDEALLAYVRTRKDVLRLAHRFFGEPGLSAAASAYRGPEDRAVLGALADRREAGAFAAPVEAKLLAEIDLLLAAPVDFIPCTARAATAPVDRSAPIR